MPEKLVLVVVDSLKTEMLDRAVREGAAPTFAALIERGVFIPDCVSSFPSVTPVASSEIVTGARADRHRVPGANWFHRGEGRYVEYGSSFQATRTFGIVRTLYDVVYNMNLSHLNPSVETLFELLGDAGIRTACTPFLIFRGRTRHEIGLEGVLRRVAEAATFRHAVYGPDELFYGELYSSRRVPCRPTLARPGTRDEYSGCVGEQLVEQDLFDFMLFSLPDNDNYSHRYGPERTVTSIAHADANLRRVVDAAGGIEPFLDEHAVIVMADHSQTPVEHRFPIASELEREWRVLAPSSEEPERAEIAVSPSARAASVYVLREGARHARIHASVREKVLEIEGAELVAWLERSGGGVLERGDSPSGGEVEAAVRSAAGELRFRPAPGGVVDCRGGRWELDGALGALGVEVRDGQVLTDEYPDGLGRLWAALTAPSAGDVLVSLREGYECVDWGGASHVGGGSHGSLRRGDSLGPLLFVGCGPDSAGVRGQWALEDVAGTILEHFGIAGGSAG